jgi:hypothetical protein
VNGVGARGAVVVDGGTEKGRGGEGAEVVGRRGGGGHGSSCADGDGATGNECRGGGGGEA